MVADFPLGIADVVRASTDTGRSAMHLPEHWYWCRRHEEAELSSTPTKRDPDPTVACVRVGPFMTKDEAELLGEMPGCRHCDDGPYPGLGLTVES